MYVLMLCMFDLHWQPFNGVMELIAFTPVLIFRNECSQPASQPTKCICTSYGDEFESELQNVVHYGLCMFGGAI